MDPTFNTANSRLSWQAAATVFVLGVEAADGDVLWRVGKGASVHHLSNQNRFLCKDDPRLLLGWGEVGLLEDHPTQLHHAVKFTFNYSDWCFSLVKSEPKSATDQTCSCWESLKEVTKNRLFCILLPVWRFTRR